MTYNFISVYSLLLTELSSSVITSAACIYPVFSDLNSSSNLDALGLAILASMSWLFLMSTKSCLETDKSMSSTKSLFNYCELEPEGTYRTQSDFVITRGCIQFCDFYLKYQPHMPYVLADLNLGIDAGSKVGIVGRTGAGKSSLMQALFRLIEPTSGTILIDNQNFLKAGLRDLRE